MSSQHIGSLQFETNKHFPLEVSIESRVDIFYAMCMGLSRGLGTSSGSWSWSWRKQAKRSSSQSDYTGQTGWIYGLLISSLSELGSQTSSDLFTVLLKFVYGPNAWMNWATALFQCLRRCLMTCPRIFVQIRNGLGKIAFGSLRALACL